MRNVVGALVAAAVGIHCSAPAEGPDSEPNEPALVAPAEEHAPARGARAAADTSDDEAPPHPWTVDLSGLVRGGAVLTVTSQVYDQMGATYATGTFVGRVVVANTTITSRGDKDVFLLKIDRAGAFEWVRAVGSAALESSPHVSLDKDRRVTITGMTKGEMDCGAGPLPTWDSSTFFVCIFGGNDGSSLSGGVFPTGNL